MGCGAICGDSASEQPTPITAALHIMRDLLPSLNKTSTLVSKQTYLTFIDLYHQDPKRFHLFPKTVLTKDESISDEVLLRWKLVLFGQDSDQKSYCSCLGLSQMSQLQPSSGLIPIQSNIESTIVYHQCFVQIEKDLDRTFSLSGGRKKDFQNVLKRIANHFPRMGYTQGINFVVGFLIIIGYSENDSFWMFVHIALNRKYLLLGLYEDGFPLCNVFCIVFKNILKRTNQPLYEHLFEVIMVDVSMWVFKWFITCFIYSFPIEMIKYAWEVMIQLGGLGIVTLAVSISNQIGSHLLQKEDMCDLSQFLKGLGEIESFNQFINLDRVIKMAYELEILPKDFQGVQGSGGFYGAYFKENCSSLQKHLNKDQGLPKFSSQTPSKSSEMLDNWYDSLLRQRQRFHQARKTVLSSDMQLPLESPEKVMKRHQSQEFDLTVSIKDEYQAAPDGISKQKINMVVPIPRNSSHEIRNYKISYHFDKINQHLEEESKSAKSISANHLSAKGPPSRKSSIVDSASDLEELDKLSMEVYTKVKQGVKINNYAAPAPRPPESKARKSIEDLHDSHSSKQGIVSHKMNMRAVNTFTMAGQNILKIDNYDAISVSSKNNSHKERIKTNQRLTVQVTGRSCACKTKTEENKAFDRNSEHASSKGQFSDKESVSRSISKENMSHTEEHPDMGSVSLENVDSYRGRLERAETHQNYMICSHGPKIRESQDRQPNNDDLVAPKEKTDTEVEVLPFKKDKKQKLGKVSHIEISKGEGSFGRAMVQPSEESLESVPPYSIDRVSVTHCSKRQGRCEACNGGACEVESIR